MCFFSGADGDRYAIVFVALHHLGIEPRRPRPSMFWEQIIRRRRPSKMRQSSNRPKLLMRTCRCVTCEVAYLSLNAGCCYGSSAGGRPPDLLDRSDDEYPRERACDA